MRNYLCALVVLLGLAACEASTEPEPRRLDVRLTVDGPVVSSDPGDTAVDVHFRVTNEGDVSALVTRCGRHTHLNTLEVDPGTTEMTRYGVQCDAPTEGLGWWSLSPGETRQETVSITYPRAYDAEGNFRVKPGTYRLRTWVFDDALPKEQPLRDVDSEEFEIR
jgi:hypothetical protein